MNSTFGSLIQYSIFGESHGEGIGIVISGLPAGIFIDEEKVNFHMERRAPGKTPLSTARSERDRVKILSGLFKGRTTGAPLCGVILNEDKKSKDYSKLENIMRPGHGDFTGKIKYKGFNDYRGGGHFSGRITAPLVFAGTIARIILEDMGIVIGSHIHSICGVKDDCFNPLGEKDEFLKSLWKENLPAINESVKKTMEEKILEVKSNGDSVGGIVECMIKNVPQGLGEPFFYSVESVLSQLLYSIPGVKGVEFGRGFEVANILGSENNDSFYVKDEKVKTKTNNSGGILGGITNGMPILVKCAVKPTPSILKKQDTINIKTMENTTLEVNGRHDPCIVPRVIPVVESACAIGVLELLTLKNGREFK